jgi:hypothetical protein
MRPANEIVGGTERGDDLSCSGKERDDARHPVMEREMPNSTTAPPEDIGRELYRRMAY